MWSMECGNGQDGVWRGVRSVGRDRMACGGSEDTQQNGEGGEDREREWSWTEPHKRSTRLTTLTNLTNK